MASRTCSTSSCRRPSRPSRPAERLAGLKAPGLSVGSGRMVVMTVTGRLELVALDATDVATLASFYAELTGWKPVRDVGDWITLRADDGQEVAFQQVAEHLPPQWP